MPCSAPPLVPTGPDGRAAGGLPGPTRDPAEPGGAGIPEPRRTSRAGSTPAAPARLRDSSLSIPGAAAAQGGERGARRSGRRGHGPAGRGTGGVGSGVGTSARPAGDAPPPAPVRRCARGNGREAGGSGVAQGLINLTKIQPHSARSAHPSRRSPCSPELPHPAGAPRPPDRAQPGRPIASRSAGGPASSSLQEVPVRDRDRLPPPRGHPAPPAKRGPRAARQPRGDPLLPRCLAINSCRPRSCPGPAWPLAGGCCRLRELLPRS